MVSSLWAMEEKKEDGPSVATLVVGAVAVAAALAVWGISKWFVVAGVVALVVWGISKCFRSFQPEPPKEKSAALAVGAAAGIALAAWGLSKWLGSSEPWGISKWFMVAGVAALVAWGISKCFRSSQPEPPKEMSAALAVGAAAGVALAAWGVSKWLESPEPESPHKEKMMKAPGRDYHMPRKDFVDNPKVYFRELRGKK